MKPENLPGFFESAGNSSKQQLKLFTALGTGLPVSRICQSHFIVDGQCKLLGTYLV